MLWVGVTRDGHPPPGEAQYYQVSFPKHMLRIRFPVVGCMCGDSYRTNLRIHFAHLHVQDTFVILEDGNRPYPRCPKCDMCVFHKALNGRHLTMSFLRRGEEIDKIILSEEEAWAMKELAITAYGIPLAPVTSFKYLGRVFLAFDDDWTSVVNNLCRARWKWARLTRVLIRESADARTLDQIYLAVVQLVILYGMYMWVTTPHIWRVLGGLNHRVCSIPGSLYTDRVAP